MSVHAYVRCDATGCGTRLAFGAQVVVDDEYGRASLESGGEKIRGWMFGDLDLCPEHAEQSRQPEPSTVDLTMTVTKRPGETDEEARERAVREFQEWLAPASYGQAPASQFGEGDA